MKYTGNPSTLTPKDQQAVHHSLAREEKCHSFIVRNAIITYSDRNMAMHSSIRSLLCERKWHQLSESLYTNLQ